LLTKDGIACPTISAGGTGSFQVTADLGVATEIEAGGGVLMDLFYRDKCGVQGLEIALTVLATVISRPCPERAVIDAGRKTLSPDLQLPAVAGRDDLAVQWLSAEHGVLRVAQPPGPSIGDVVRLIPGYGDWTTMLHDHYFVGQEGRLVEIWPLQARGRLD
jgi:D-serine deaminase-like pyridoxal phosphate-dependent protein